MDPEKGQFQEKSKIEKDNSNSSIDYSGHGNKFYDPSKESRLTRIGLNLESFKRAPGIPIGQPVEGTNVDLDKVLADGHMLQPKMKTRHLNMIAVGGSIGTGLFVGTGAALHDGGPAGVLIAWILIGAMLINVTQALGEMAILFPVSGGFYTLAGRFLDPSFAFAMGWNYVFQWAVVLPLEITVASLTVNYWPNNVPTAAWITIFYLLIIIASLFGTLGFAEEEFWSSCLKLAVVVVGISIPTSPARVIDSTGAYGLTNTTTARVVALLTQTHISDLVSTRRDSNTSYS